MLERLTCAACGSRIPARSATDAAPPACPKCGRPYAADGPEEVAAGPSVFHPRAVPEVVEEGRPSWRRRAGLGLMILLPILGVGILVARPWLNGFWADRLVVSDDPAALVAQAYLQALVDGDRVTAERLGTVAEPPAIDSFRGVERDRNGPGALRGSFAPLARLHATIKDKYDYDSATGRFTPKNPLGPAAETLDALHEVKTKAEAEGLYRKMQSGDPEDLFDAAEALASAYQPLAVLAETVLAPAKLVPTYKHFIEDANPLLGPTETELALDYAGQPETWQALLKRPFTTLEADGPFILERAEVTALVRDTLASSGDPPTRLRLTLKRFRLEGIDTGWRVTAARRVTDEPAPPAPPRDEPASPGTPAIP